MAAFQRFVSTLLLVATLCIGASLAAHETNKVPMPEGTTIWMVCMDTPAVIEHHYIGCYSQLDAYMQGRGNDITSQCSGLSVLNECIKYNVSLHCPDLYRQFYRDMASFMPTVILFCGSTMGLITIEEWEHIVWANFERLYLDHLAEQTTTQQPAVTTASGASADFTTQAAIQNNGVDDINGTSNATNTGIDSVVNSTVSDVVDEVNGTANATNSGTNVEDDVSSGDDDVKMVTDRMQNDIRNVTERFMAATTAAPRVSLMEVLTTAAAAAAQAEGKATD